jgi:MoaA/NifB/PqqE/SkfB family radical SAM enzyme
MFKFSQIKQVHLEITNNCQASCPMCSRNISGGLPNDLIKVHNWSLEDFKTIMNPTLLSQLHGYYFCGTFGDPMLNDNLIEMCRYSTEVAPNVQIAIHTNGSARSTKWWTELAQALPNDHFVVFALDGLADTQALYRVGTDFNKIIKNAKAFIDAGGKAEWCFIKFKHNEHQVEEARQMAKELGFAEFRLKNSSRFIIEPKKAVLNKDGQVTHYIEPATDTPLTFIDRKAIAAYKEIVADSDINCKAQNDREIYIDAYKDFYPCCWIANIPYTPVLDDESANVRFEMKKQHDDLMAKIGTYNVLERPLEEIIDSEAFQTMWEDNWGKDKLIVCARSCGVNKFAKCTDQEVK